MVQFLRRDSNKYSKLGNGRKKKQVWRKPTGRHNKMREKKRGYPVVVSIGYKTEKDKRNQIEGKNPVMINTIKDLIKITKNDIVILGKMGEKKKLEIAKKIKEIGAKAVNLNVNKYLVEKENKK